MKMWMEKKCSYQQKSRKMVNHVQASCAHKRHRSVPRTVQYKLVLMRTGKANNGKMVTQANNNNQKKINRL